MNKRYSFHIAIFLITLTMVFSSCGSSRPTVDPEELQRAEDDLRRREQEVQQRTIEIMDLKNQIIILQSEISDLKSTIIEMEGQTDSMKNRILREKESSKELEGKLSELDEKNLELIRMNEKLQSYLTASQDSIRRALETEAVRESERNLLKAIAMDTDTLEDSADESKTVKDTRDRKSVV